MHFGGSGVGKTDLNPIGEQGMHKAFRTIHSFVFHEISFSQ
jgi:hypothetical protein